MQKLIILKTSVKVILLTFVIFFTILGASSFIPYGKSTLARTLVRNNRGVGDLGYSLERFRDIGTILDSESLVDVVIIGSSHAYRGIDPTIFEGKGLNAVNLGSSAQSPLNSYFLAKEYLPKIKNAQKKLIIEAYYDGFQSDGVESFFDISINLPDQKSNIAWDMAFSIGTPEVYTSLISTQIERGIKPISSQTQQTLSENYYYKGFVGTATQVRETDLVCNFKIPDKLSETQLKYFYYLIELAKKLEYEVITVVHPLPVKTIECMPDYEKLTKPIELIAKEQGVKFRDFNLEPSGSITYLNTDFADTNHLNKQGAEKFTKDLLEWIY